jgi:hypothetical protein
MIPWDGKGSVTEFVERYKFGPLHPYDIEEWRAAVEVGEVGMLFVRDELRASQRSALRQLAAEHCGQMTIGWMALSESRQLLPELGMTEASLPFFAFTRNGTSCHFVSRNRTASLTVSGFFGRARDPEIPCGNSEAGRETRENASMSTREERKSGSANGGLFVVISCAVGMGVIGLLQTQPSRERKAE